MSKYLQYYKDIFDGKPFIRNGKEITIKEKSVFDGGGIRLIYDELDYELDKRGSGTILDFGGGTAVHWHVDCQIPGQRQKMTATKYFGIKLRGFYRYDPAHPLYCIKPTGKFDIVMCTEVLEHVPIDELPELLKEIASYMLDDGIAIFSIPKGLSNNAFPDGSNLHITLMGTKEWNELIETYIPQHVLVHHGHEKR
jgi:hypothetical protein